MAPKKNKPNLTPTDTPQPNDKASSDALFSEAYGENASTIISEEGILVAQQGDIDSLNIDLETDSPNPERTSSTSHSLDSVQKAFSIGTEQTFDTIRTFQENNDELSNRSDDDYNSLGERGEKETLESHATGTELPPERERAEGRDTSEDDIIKGDDNKNTLYGQEGNDTLMGGKGADLLDGGTGDDTLQASVDGTWTSNYVAHNVETGESISLTGQTASYDVFDGGEGYDTIEMGATDDALFLDDSFSSFYNNTNQARITDVEEINAGAGDDIIDLTSNYYSVSDITLKGGEGDDHLWSSDGKDSLYGEAGNDSLYGGSGDDFLDGGSGADRLAGGSGDDTFVFDINDTSIDGGTGTDTVQINGGAFDFSTLDGLLNDVEILDLNNGATLTIDSAFVAGNAGSAYTLQVDGDSTSQVTFEDNFTNTGTTTIEGQNYDTYTFDNITINIDTDTSVVLV